MVGKNWTTIRNKYFVGFSWTGSLLIAIDYIYKVIIFVLSTLYWIWTNKQLRTFFWVFVELISEIFIQVVLSVATLILTAIVTIHNAYNKHDEWMQNMPSFSPSELHQIQAIKLGIANSQVPPPIMSDPGTVPVIDANIPCCKQGRKRSMRTVHMSRIPRTNSNLSNCSRSHSVCSDSSSPTGGSIRTNLFAGHRREYQSTSEDNYDAQISDCDARVLRPTNCENKQSEEVLCLADAV